MTVTDLRFLIYRPGSRHQTIYPVLNERFFVGDDVYIDLLPNPPFDGVNHYYLKYIKYGIVSYVGDGTIYVHTYSQQPIIIESVIRARTGVIAGYAIIVRGRRRYHTGRGIRYIQDSWVVHRHDGRWNLYDGRVFSSYPRFLPYLRTHQIIIGSREVVFELRTPYNLVEAKPEESCDFAEKRYIGRPKYEPQGVNYYMVVDNIWKCPICTCAEVINGNNVCCYGGDGKPILHYQKPLFI